MNRDPAVAVFDIGKSNAKLALVDLATNATVAIRTTTNQVSRDGPYPHFDVERLWTWFMEGLAALAARADITAISITTHGACFALLDGEELALPVLDYEFDGPEALNGAYDRLRGAFSETFSPGLPQGLNAGRQLYWLSRRFPEAFARVDTILPYPQYWAWRLSGAKTAEATSLGCHTDLWNPRFATYSKLATEQNWTRLFPPLVKAWDVLGTITPKVAAATGLSPACRVIAGIHDSNASLLPHVLGRQPPFAVLSTGTWMVVMAPGGEIDRLDATRDCLANVDALGRAVPSARFMAGREYEILTGDGAEPSEADLVRVVRERIMALPTFAPGTGPYGAHAGRWTREPSLLAQQERTAAATLYCALVAETCLKLAGAEGPAIVEGPFSRNRWFLAALARLIRRPVIARPDATGTTSGAALLALGPKAAPESSPDPAPAMPLEIDLDGYAAAWRQAAEQEASIGA